MRHLLPILLSAALHMGVLAVVSESAGLQQPKRAETVALRVIEPPPPPPPEPEPEAEPEPEPEPPQVKPQKRREPPRKRQARRAEPAPMPPSGLAVPESGVSDLGSVRVPVVKQLDLDLKFRPGAFEPQLVPSVPRTRTAQEEILQALRPLRGGGYRYADTEFGADVMPDGSVRFTGGSGTGLCLYELGGDGLDVSDCSGGGGAAGAPSDNLGGPQAGGSTIKMDLTTAIMNAIGEDPYGALKFKFLEETRGFRADLSAKYRARRLRASVQEARRTAISILDDDGATIAGRKRLLFDMWDECAEGEGAVAEAGAQVRATIVSVIRLRLPSTHPDAFARDEIAALNAQRRSAQRFAPYGPAAVEP